MLTAENLSARRGRRLVLDRIDLEVRPRELVAVVGPAGAGKTTLLEGAVVEPLELTASRRAFYADSYL